jgi:hypothetical protein
MALALTGKGWEWVGLDNAANAGPWIPPRVNVYPPTSPPRRGLGGFAGEIRAGMRRAWSVKVGIKASCPEQGLDHRP